MEELETPTDLFEPLEMPRDAPPLKRRSAWLRETLQEVHKHATHSNTFRERKRPQRDAGYVAQMTHIIDAYPSTYEEVVRQQVWKDIMMEEYQSIMKNEVWEVIPRLEGKSIYVVSGSVKKYQARFVVHGFSQKEGIDYDETFPAVTKYTSIITIISLAATLG